MRNAVELVLILFAGHVHGWTPAEPAAQVVQNALNKAIATNGKKNGAGFNKKKAYRMN